jgi:hypothetical protein
MIKLPYLTAIRISGKDAGQFLHSQLSADVLGLSGGQTTFACYCEPKGRVLALMLVGRDNDDFYVILSHSLAASIVQRLKIYVMRAKVNVEILEACAISGLPAGQVSRALPWHIAKLGLPQSSDSLLVTDNGPEYENAPNLVDAWKLAELKRGIIWLNTETSGQFLPQMLGFDRLGAVNFKKGCYPGQEIVARTHYLGKVKRHPRLLNTSAIICADPLDPIQVFNDEHPYDAVIADSGRREEGGSHLFVITRMNPDLPAEKIEYQGQIAPLFYS